MKAEHNYSQTPVNLTVDLPRNTLIFEKLYMLFNPLRANDEITCRTIVFVYLPMTRYLTTFNVAL